MSELTYQELEKTARAYEDLLVPALFAECAEQLVEAAGIEPGQRVLDVACGTGVVARLAAERVGPEGSVAGVDINPGMLAVARRSSADIDWREGSVDDLPYEDGTFDAVLCQFGLMFFPDPVKALQEMARVLEPGGRLAVSTFDSIERQPAYREVTEVYGRVIDPSVREASRGPYAIGETEDLASLFAEAGIDTVEITTREPKIRASSVRDLIWAEVEGWFPFAEIRVDEATVEAASAEAEQVLAPFLSSDGAVEAPVTAHIATAEAA